MKKPQPRARSLKGVKTHDGGGFAGGIAQGMKSGMQMAGLMKQLMKKDPSSPDGGNGGNGGSGGSGGNGGGAVDTGTWDTSGGSTPPANARGGKVKKVAKPHARR